MSAGSGYPTPQGLYDPANEHDACGLGFVADIRGRRSHAIVRDGLKALENLDHRGACGWEDNTGDGAGVLIQVPDRFLREVFLAEQCRTLGVAEPGPGEYGVGAFFAPSDPEQRTFGMGLFEKIVAKEGQVFLGWRKLETDNTPLGEGAKSVEPAIYHAFVGRGPGMEDEERFERKLYVIRKRFERDVEKSGLDDHKFFYFCSLSCRTVVYKGMLTPLQLGTYFAADLGDERVVSALCLFHSRFSTNTFPSWELAHPHRMISHNGEINTLRGNINWMRAREALFASDLYEAGDVAKLRPIIREGLSDTACLDNAVELLVRSGYSLPHAMMMLMPEAWENHATMSAEKKDFYRYHTCLMEAWDGPASVGFTDGKAIGAMLDRNGLRPSRYWVTKDGRVVMGSEAGVLEVAPEDVVLKGRLEPGKMFLVDLEEGRIVEDEEIKHRVATARPYGEYLRDHMVPLAEVPEAPHVPGPDHETLLHRQQAFGYTLEDLKYILGPMGNGGEEAIGSMGTDTPLAVLSDRAQPLFNYFQQLFAQVTNPPLDAIREELVTSVLTGAGGEGNLLMPTPESCRQIALDLPVLDNDELARLKQLEGWRGFKSAVLPMTFVAAEGAAGMERALEAMFALAVAAIEDGANLLILSDRGVDAANAPIPSLLACSGLHHHLVREKLRTRAGLIVECGDAREVHHFALLLGYGAGTINPYVAFETLDDMIGQGMIKDGIDHAKAVDLYRKAIKKGVVKVMSKMGISTIQSYRGAQIFEAIGLNEGFVTRYFDKTSSRIGGVGLEAIAEETLHHHRRAYADREVGPPMLDWGGQYQWRREGEYHLFNPETVFRLQHATKTGRFEVFQQYARMVDEQNERLCTLRGLFAFKTEGVEPVPLEEVEPAEAIFHRFATGAMSYGSISGEAHETMAIAMNRIGGRSNTGEGGEDPARNVPDANGDDRRSKIKQVASGRFGVTSEYLVSADEIQIKIAQGAKPGEGGQLPGHKVSPTIAKVRHSTPGVALISPPPHHDIYSIEDLAQLIHDLKNANPRARISTKLVAEVGVGTVAAGVAKAHSDVILISGHDGGTGASPLTSLKHAGAPWELGLAETQQTLVLNRLRDRVVVQADGQMKTGRDVVVAALLGAEEYGFATAPLVVMGCIMMRVCHLDTCPVGIATQNPKLREKFAGKAEHLVNFFRFVAEEVRELMAELGFRKLDDMIGRSDLLDMKSGHRSLQGPKGLDFSSIFFRPDTPPDSYVRKMIEQDHGLEKALDQRLLPLAAPALERGEAVEIDHADPQRQPDGRHHPRLRGDAASTAAPACPTTRSA